MSGVQLFHFLYPWWLAALPAVLLCWWMVRRREARSTDVGNLLAPHLTQALTVNRRDRRRLRPVDGVALAAISTALAAAGPSWSLQSSPWYAESAPLVVAVEVSDSMRASDLLPTRLDRARFKLLELIEARDGARTAVIAYDGSAHIVVPPSLDVAVLRPLLESLDPAIMPVSGTAAATALPLAMSLLGEDAAIGTVLFVNDGFAASDVAAFAEFRADADAPRVAALVVGTEQGGVALMPDGSPVRDARGARIDTAVDTALLTRMERRAGVNMVRLSAGDQDINALLRIITGNLEQQAADPQAQWRNQGWWLLWPAMLLSLAWFRRGWTMQW
jgi:Ca-activated chloride channel family protein